MWHAIMGRPAAGLAHAALLFSSWAFASPTSFDEKRDILSVLQAREGEKWVATWTSMPQLVEQNNMPPSPFVSCLVKLEKK